MMERLRQAQQEMSEQTQELRDEVNEKARKLQDLNSEVQAAAATEQAMEDDKPSREAAAVSVPQKVADLSKQQELCQQEVINLEEECRAIRSRIESLRSEE